MKAEFPKWTKQFQKSYPNLAGFSKAGWRMAQAQWTHARGGWSKIGIAAGHGSQGAVRSAVRNALAEGVLRDEIRHAVLLSITTIGSRMVKRHSAGRKM